MARILIVDDEQDVRSTLAKALKGVSHEVFEAIDGEDALRQLSEHEMDVVVTDIIMPNREGLETIQEIRLNWPQVKIIAISGGGRLRNVEFLLMARKLGADFTLKKPFSMNEFISAVRQLLDAPPRQSE